MARLLLRAVVAGSSVCKSSCLPATKLGSRHDDRRRGEQHREEHEEHEEHRALRDDPRARVGRCTSGVVLKFFWEGYNAEVQGVRPGLKFLVNLGLHGLDRGLEFVLKHLPGIVLGYMERKIGAWSHHHHAGREDLVNGGNQQVGGVGGESRESVAVNAGRSGERSSARNCSLKCRKNKIKKTSTIYFKRALKIHCRFCSFFFAASFNLKIFDQAK